MLSPLDQKILFELDCDSRQSYSKLAKKLKQGRDKVEYRIQRLAQHGIIRSFSTTINFYRLGYTIYKTYFRFKNNKKRVKEFYAYLSKKPYVYRFAVYAGIWDANLGTAARNAREFHEYHSELLSNFHDIISDYAMYTIIDVWRFRKGFLIGQKTPGLLTGGDVGGQSIDKTDYNILKHLALNSRISHVELGDKIDVSPSVVKYRIEQLEKRGIIIGYRVDTDHEKLGLLHFKAQLFLSSYKQAQIKKLREFAEATPEISHLIVQLGDCPFEIEIQVPSLNRYNEIVDQMREDFSDLIQNVHSMLMHKEEFQWLPHAEGLIA